MGKYKSIAVKYLQNGLVMGMSLVVTLGALELFTRMIFEEEPKNYYEHRSKQPEPYQDADYFSLPFIKESLFEQPGDWINPEGARIIYPANYEGEFFSIKNHRRVTTNQPDSAKYRILLFGGSTIYNSEVPDRHTIASYLQRSVNEKIPDTYQVLNYGVTSVNTNQQLERLKSVEIREGDIIVFYGGVNDGLLFTTGRPDGWIIGENFVASGSDQLNMVQMLRLKIYKRLHQRSRFVEKFLNPFTYEVPPHLDDELKIAEMKVTLADNYSKAVAKADSIARGNGAGFYNYLQPTILTRKELTPYEAKLIKNKYLVAEAWLLALKYSYDVLHEEIKRLNERGVRSEDLSSVLDESTDSHYLDYCHITEKGNRLIATAIFNSLFNSTRTEK